MQTNKILQAINAVLLKDEVIKWQGQPNPKTHTIDSLPIFLCGIPWTGFSLFRLFVVEEFKMPDFSATYDYFPLFGIPFLIIGIGMLLSPCWYYLRAKKMIYVITNQRAFSIILGKSDSIQIYPTRTINNIEKIEYAHDSGDLFWDNSSSDPLFLDATKTPPSRDLIAKKMGFKGISELHNAFTTLEKLK